MTCGKMQGILKVTSNRVFHTKRKRCLNLQKILNS